MASPLRRAFLGCGFALLLCAALSGCSLNQDIGGPSALVKTGGDQQSAPANTLLPLPLVVTVVDQFGQTIDNVPVTWAIISGGGSLSATSSVTDADGNASVTYTTGPTAGNAVIRANAPNGLFISFTATIT